MIIRKVRKTASPEDGSCRASFFIGDISFGLSNFRSFLTFRCKEKTFNLSSKTPCRGNDYFYLQQTVVWIHK